MVVVFLVGAFWLWFWVTQNRQLFPVHRLAFSPSAKPQSGDSVWLTHDWGKTEMWWLPAMEDSAEPKPAIIIAHGQMGLIDTWEDRLTPIRQKGFHCLLIEFPGYGRSEGLLSEPTLTDSLTASYDWLVKQRNVNPDWIIGLGRSMGGGVISLLPAHRPLSCLWLMSTFTSLRPFVARKGLPGFLLKCPLDNVASIRQHSLPTLILHGSEDTVVPISHGRTLASAATDAEFVIEKAGHDDCPRDWEQYWSMAATFFERHVKSPHNKSQTLNGSETSV